MTLSAPVMQYSQQVDVVIPGVNKFGIACKNLFHCYIIHVFHAYSHKETTPPYTVFIPSKEAHSERELSRRVPLAMRPFASGNHALKARLTNVISGCLVTHSRAPIHILRDDDDPCRIYILMLVEYCDK